MKISVLTSTLPFLIIIIMEIKQHIYLDIWEYTKRFLSIDAKPTTSKLNDFTILTTVFIHDFAVWIPWWIRHYRVCLQYRRCRFNPWVRKIPWRRKWQPTLVFLPGEFYGQRSLAGSSPWGCMTERLHFHLQPGQV